MKSYSEQWEQSKAQAKAYPMDQLLQHLNIKLDQYGRVYCPFHADVNNASASIGKSNILKCFAGGCTASRAQDTVSVYMHVTGADLVTAVNAINELQGVYIPATEVSKSVSKRKESTSSPEENYKKFLCYFTDYKLLNKQEKNIVDSFLNSRKLCDTKAVLDMHGVQIGLDRNKNVCFNFAKQGFGLVRGKHHKSNMGSPKPTAFRVNKYPIWFVTEGVTDALTACVLGFNTMCLNSTNNTDMLVELIKKDVKATTRHYVICLDADTAGTSATQKLVDFFAKNNCYYTVSKVLDGIDFKDLNQLYVAGVLKDYLTIRSRIDAGDTKGNTVFGNKNNMKITDELLSYIGWEAYIPKLNDYCGEICFNLISP